MLLAGLRPGGSGSDDPAVLWLVTALLVPLASTLFGLLFISTLVAARRSVSGRSPSATVLVAAALVTLVLLLPLAGPIGGWLAKTADWTAVGADRRGLSRSAHRRRPADRRLRGPHDARHRLGR